MGFDGELIMIPLTLGFIFDCKSSKLFLNIEQKHWGVTLQEILMNIDCGRIKEK